MNLAELVKQLTTVDSISISEYNKAYEDIEVKIAVTSVNGEVLKLLDISAIYFNTTDVLIGQENTLHIEILTNELT